MWVRYYPAIVESGEDGFYCHFPDLPGCISHGATMDELAANAENVLSMHLAGMTEDGEPLPMPSPVEGIPHDPDVAEVGRLLVRGELVGGQRAGADLARAPRAPSA